MRPTWRIVPVRFQFQPLSYPPLLAKPFEVRYLKCGIRTIMLSSRSMRNRSAKSPVSEVPYDVLKEIFLHCLPRYPLQNRQPNTTIAPMLLCQICSSWRMVAITSPTLWSHLSYDISLYNVDDKSGSFTFPQKEFDFMLWWKRNQGSVAPLLRLGVTDEKEDEVPQTHRSAGDCMSFFLKYLTSAQYLQLSPFLETVLERRKEFGSPVICPNLHTVVTCAPRDKSADDFYGVPDYALSLRRLAIHEDYRPRSYNNLTNWSTLTHLWLGGDGLPLDFWFSLIRALPNLQWAYIHFRISHDIESKKAPTSYIHPRLSMLFVVSKWSTFSGSFPLRLVFAGPHLPVLHTLSLYSDGVSDTISGIHTVLQSTPAIKLLIIRGDHFKNIFATIRDIKPVWNSAPHLIHLQLGLPDVDFDSLTKAEIAEILDNFVGDLFLSNRRWMDLDNSACPIRTITLINETWLRTRLDFFTVKYIVITSIQERTRGPSNITFNVISLSESKIAEETWKEWGSST